MKGRGGAAVSDVFRYEEVPPSHQPSGGGHEAGSPLGRRPWSARRGHGLPRASATWLAPGCRPHKGAAPQLRFVVGRYAATAARYAARRLVPRSGTTTWPRRGAATRHRYGVPVQSLFMKPSRRDSGPALRERSLGLTKLNQQSNPGRTTCQLLVLSHTPTDGRTGHPHRVSMSRHIKSAYNTPSLVACHRGNGHRHVTGPAACNRSPCGLHPAASCLWRHGVQHRCRAPCRATPMLIFWPLLRSWLV